LQASDITKGYPGKIDENPWLLKVPPETRVYDILRGSDRDLGFDHLVDELRNAINPESGLPAALRWKYQDLDKVTVPQAVERVAKINEWRAANKAEADMARAMGPATQVVKEYPEQGFKWVELKLPEKTGKKEARRIGSDEAERIDEGVDRLNEDDLQDFIREQAKEMGIRRGTPEYEELAQELKRDFGPVESEVDSAYNILEDALKYEGETMGHCVGNYCPDVVEGRSKIFSLRDKKGQPHVTIEVRPGEGSVYQYLASKNLDLEKEAQKLYPKSSKIASQDLLISDIEATPEYAEWVRSLPQEIVQIKGSGKKDRGQKIRHSGTGYKDNPDAHLLPAVQDFIRSGNWSKIGDLENAGLVDVQDPNALLRALGKVSPERNIDQAIDNFNTAIDSAPNAQRYMTLDELRDFLGGSAGPEGLAQGGQVRGYAEGGLVANSPTVDFDPARIDAIVGELHAMNAG
jgi:hypothetical protein